MDILFYYILRRFFVSVHFRGGEIVVGKGLFFVRTSTLHLRSVTVVEIRRTPLLRILRAKQITLRTLGGKAVEFYLQKDEPLPFLPKTRGAALRPKTSSVLFGAFIDTRALSGVVIFSATVRRIGAIFGSAYYDSILAAIQNTAEGVSEVLSLLHIAVPGVAAVLAVFVFAAWVFALLKKVTAMAHFRVTIYGGVAAVRRGLFTLRETYISVGQPCCFSACDTAATLVTKYSPLYLRGEMILPPTRREKSQKLIRALLGKLPHGEKNSVSPPKRALFGHCALPLGWGAGFAAALILVAFMQGAGILRYAELLKTALWCGMAAFLWTAAVYAAYMFRSGMSQGEIIRISSRRFARLYTVYSRRNSIVSAEIIQNPLQKRDGFCDCRIVFHERVTVRLRQVPADGARHFVSRL